MANLIFDRVRDSGVPNQTQPARTIGWANEIISESESFNKSQYGYDLIQPSMDAIMGKTSSTPFNSRLSKTNDNEFGRIATALVAGMTDIRPFWDFRTKNKSFDRHAANLNKRSEHWWGQSQADLRYMDGIKWASVAGSSFMHFTGWDSDKNDIGVLAEDPRDVLPIRPNSNHTIQDALGVAIRRARTIEFIEALYPEWKGMLKPDREVRYGTGMGQPTRADQISSALTYGLSNSPFFKALDAGEAHQTIPSIPVKDLFTVYIRDDSINTLNMPVTEGEGRFRYVVPPKWPRYPRKRMIIFCKGIDRPLYDGPAQNIHGLFPICKLTLDPWPWTWLGKAPLWDVLPLQESLTRTYRLIDDHNERLAEPGVWTDQNALSDAAHKLINTRLPGLKARINSLLSQGKSPMDLLHEPNLDPAVKDHLLHILERMGAISGAKDFSDLFRLNQVPSGDTIEKIIQTMSPGMRLRSRYLESFIREFALMAAANFLQHDTTQMRLQILGPDGLTLQDFDYSPDDMIPDYPQPDEYQDGVYGGILKPDILKRGPAPFSDRARYFMTYFTFNIAPGSLLNASEITRKLMYLQLARMGLIDHWTLLEVMGVPNVGDPPTGAITITQRLEAEAVAGVRGMLQQALGGSPSGTGGGGGNGGRPPSAQAMPKMEMKDGGTRSTITES